MKFLVLMPGLIRYPPSMFPPGNDNWQTRMTCADYQRAARAADELGFDALSVSEHLALPVELEAAMGADYPHASTAMAFLAGATSRIRVNSMVMVLPYHHPVNLAKAIATLDVMSGGRAMVTFGVGMAPSEFRALGVPFERRGRITDEYTRAMKALWTEHRPEFAGEYVQFSGVVFEPKPVQRPHPPLWFGGRSRAAMRRAAVLGDGWAPSGALLGDGPWLEEPEQLPGLLDEIRALRAEHGLDRAFDVFLSVEQHRFGPNHTPLPSDPLPDSGQGLVDAVCRLGALGATWTMATRPHAPEPTLDAWIENLQWIADEVVAHC